ncbi:MAG: hypothetical protein LBU51_01280, partial [Bacteroidales bacterium]|nr:hypothetical protein [Bacteroidales bacterium]
IVLHFCADLKKKGVTVSQLIADIKTYANSGEINFKIEDKEGAIEAVKHYFTQTEKVVKMMDFDGYRIEFENWWFNVRPSNTEPYLRLLVEAKNETLLHEKLDQMKNILADYE